ncbi:5-formyltetrahydrofolate cyclo-ligase [Emticicia oligotrophica DSM 17448]|uniref:5-formyltetrahydrofolate cyclo-ligase n=1 Tax=Emticicia oligotrophica (strain DSM 17448 / CIP 109782 / MTCC 6937 / GPTSA100-15) TaxID=929562 RepID=A0ABN4ALX8_EMTOG|nr:5-formyltetrahydrofolate cyclo-ligase [Emticicia oligotrophica]AFK03303.1 5-formyltetrahydrofolate cyclo-ligase [Emticicia oligotrophica DSM 17448]
MQKQDLRKEYLRQRKALSEQVVEGFSRKIHDWFFRSFAVHSFATIHTFLPIKHNNEVDTWLIIKTLQKDFAADIVIPKSHPNGTMTNYLLTEKTVLEESNLKIIEPNETQNSELRTQNSKIDLVLIPLLCFDKKGYRVGYGKGYYDRFLAECRPDVMKIGLSLFEPVEEIAIDEFDVKMDYCITPNKIWSFL